MHNDDNKVGPFRGSLPDPKDVLARARAKFESTYNIGQAAPVPKQRRDPTAILAEARAKFGNNSKAGKPRRSDAHADEVDALWQQVTTLELAVGKLIKEVTSLKALLTAKQKPLRAIRVQVEMMVASYLKARGGNPDTVWGKLYQELENRHGFDVYSYAVGGMSLLDTVETQGLMEEFYKIVRDTYF